MGPTHITSYTGAAANALVAPIPGMLTCVRPSPHRHQVQYYIWLGNGTNTSVDYSESYGEFMA